MNATTTKAAAVVFSDIAMRVFGIVRALDDAVSDGVVFTDIEWRRP